jgi:hypothetical protein
LDCSFGDFREVEENFKDIVRNIYEKQSDKSLSKGKILQYTFDSLHELRQTEQGKSFYAFWTFLLDDLSQEELKMLVNDVYKILDDRGIEYSEKFLRKAKTVLHLSGRKVFIQGLLTLIVPEKRLRFYEHQRTEESYVQGEYGDIETETGRQIQKLRDDKSKAFSILLATFKNEEKFVTLIQARWFSGTEMKRKYIIAFKKLNIADDIKPF